MTNSNATTFLLHPACDSVSYYDEKVIVLCDELILNRLGMTNTGSEVLAIEVGDLAVADSYIDTGFLLPVKVKATLAK